MPASLPLSNTSGIALSSSGTVVVGGRTSSAPVLLASFDGGATWTMVYQGSDTILISELGFTTATQGVAIIGNRLLMTVDGGHSWNPMSFG
jgi:photosystem II stability/assembly factor-like uncharacterized protein